jgi:hypothetical protein
MEAYQGTLPGGFVDDAGQLHREFELGVLTGREEELLVQAARLESAALVTTVLSRCLRRLGSFQPVPEEITRQLLVADRQYLLLKLRQATFGDRVHADLFCPWPDCKSRASIEFSISTVPVEALQEKGPLYELLLSPAAAGSPDPARREVTFRLPVGADQEAVSPILATNEALALTQLLARCVRRIGPLAPPDDGAVAALSPLARAEIEAEMERLAPKVENSMETTCPGCGRSFMVPFDIQRFFFGELRHGVDLLYREVHYLAYHYHWSEREIMDMTLDKRRKYIEVLAEEIERLNNGG